MCDPPASQGASCPAGAVLIRIRVRRRLRPATMLCSWHLCGGGCGAALLVLLPARARLSTSILLRWQATSPSRLGHEGTTEAAFCNDPKGARPPSPSTHHPKSFNAHSDTRRRSLRAQKARRPAWLLPPGSPRRGCHPSRPWSRILPYSFCNSGHITSASRSIDSRTRDASISLTPDAAFTRAALP